MGGLLPGVLSTETFQSLTTTCGASPTRGRSTATTGGRSIGSSPGTSAGSTQPGRTDGCSVTGKPVPLHQRDGLLWWRVLATASGAAPRVARYPFPKVMMAYARLRTQDRSPL